MGDAKRRKDKNKPIELPVSDKAEISETTIYPTIEAMWIESIQKLPWFMDYSRETRRTLKFTFYTAVAETLRTVSFRMNADQTDQVFGDFDKELRAYDRELQHAVEQASAELH